MEVQSNSPLKSVPADYCPPGADCWFEIPQGNDAGKQLFYFDHRTRNEPSEATILFVHGNPECSYTYRHVRESLCSSGKSLRLIGMDHIGFGASDQAHYEMVDMHHSANLAQLIKHLDLKKLILVIHDWGGPIGIGALENEMDRVDGLVVLNTSIFPMPQEGITYANWPLKLVPWSRFPFVVPDMAWGGAAARAVLHANPAPLALLYFQSFLFQLQFMLHLVPRHSPEWVFSEALRSKANARSSKRNVLQTPVYGYGYSYADSVVGEQNNHVYYKTMQQALPKCWGPGGRTIPVVGHFGSWDPLGKESVIAQWHEALPQMQDHTHVYPDCGHFIEEHKGPEIAESVLALCARAA